MSARQGHGRPVSLPGRLLAPAGGVRPRGPPLASVGRVGLLGDLRGAAVGEVLTSSEAVLALRGAEFPGLVDRRPSAVVRPTNFRQVSRALQVLSANDEPVTIIGGSHGPRGAVDGVTCIDLRSIPRAAEMVGDRIAANGSCLVRDVLAADPAGELVVPAGVAATPGMGLLTTAGVGGLTRSLGLSIDSLESVTLLLSNGAELVVDSSSEDDLWWAVRGAATRLGVVAGATFRSHRVPIVTETRLLTRMDALAQWAQTAPALPRTTSLSWISVPATDGGEPLLMLDEVTVGPQPHGAAAQVAGASASGVLSEQTWQHAYRDHGHWMIPSDPAHGPAPLPEEYRMDTAALWCSAEGVAGIVAELAEAVAEAPPWCNVQVQHAGGALGDVTDDATAFFGRSAEYNVVLGAVWPAQGRGKLGARDWLRGAEKAVSAAMISRYATDVRRGEFRIEAKVRQIYGPQLPRLREVAERLDPADRFRYAPPF